MERTDRELVEGVLNGRSEAPFKELYDRHAVRVYRVALRITQNPRDAEDVLQETWFRATVRLAAFRWESSFSTWLTGIAANVARELLQRDRRWEPSLGVLAEPVVNTAEFIDLERAIAALSASERAVLILHDVEGLTHAEIAAQLSWSTGTSKSLLHRARHSVARRLGRLKPEKNYDLR
jgi:RNA polymerase sigma factor (sigma-70 family)